MNAYFIFLVRKNQVAQLALHLLAGLIAVTFLSGAATGNAKHEPVAPAALSASPALPVAASAGTLAIVDQSLGR